MRFSSFTASCRVLLLDGAQELDLHGHGELRHLVEEQGSPCAAWKSPGWSATAPVKLPFLCPKNSLSKRSCGMAPQLTDTNGWPARGP